MRILCLEHAEGEGPGRIAAWAAERCFQLERVRVDQASVLPDPASAGVLIIMGGPMNIYEHRSHPWLMAEKRLIQAAVDAQKPMLGICLGSQLIADVLGGKVFQNEEIEIGWHPVHRVGDHPVLADIFPAVFTPLHWHGDTFSLPADAQLFASSEACENQAFISRRNIVGLQFHIEAGPEEVSDFISSLGDERGRWVQSREHMLRHSPVEAELKLMLWRLLDYLTGLAQ